MITHPLTPEQKRHLFPGRVSRFMDLFRKAGLSIRVVGGAVRDSLIGLPTQDHDFATPEEPDQVQTLLRSHGVKTLSRGSSLAHGTVLALFEGQIFEVTTLRRDVRTDGRHAHVVYTRDWSADARRRDFTVNALYADSQGVVYDCVGGLSDLIERRGFIRFIGEAEQRIREDRLRILRFFRFVATHQKDATPDPQALEACQKQAASVVGLSGERVWFELKQLLEKAKPENLVPILKYMGEVGVLKAIFSDHQQVKPENLTLPLAQAPGDPPVDAPLMLAALVCFRRLDLVAERLKLPTPIRKRFKNLEQNSLQEGLDDNLLRRLLYRSRSIQSVCDLLFKARIVCCGHDRIFDRVSYEHIRSAWQNLPIFPVRAVDLPHLHGPNLGKELRRLEEMWIVSQFRLSREELIQHSRHAD